MAHGDAREGKWRGNCGMEWVASTLHTTSEHGVSSTTTADAHTSTASSRLNWRPPADLNGLVRFGERRNLVSARVPSHFNRPLIRKLRNVVMLEGRQVRLDFWRTKATEGSTWYFALVTERHWPIQTRRRHQYTHITYTHTHTHTDTHTHTHITYTHTHTHAYIRDTRVCTYTRCIYLRTVLFWVITQRVVVISYKRFVTTCRSHLQSSRILEPSGWDRYIVPKRRQEITTTRCVMTQKRAVPRYLAGEVWNQARLRKYLRSSYVHTYIWTHRT